MRKVGQIRFDIKQSGQDSARLAPMRATAPASFSSLFNAPARRCKAKPCRRTCSASEGAASGLMHHQFGMFESELEDSLAFFAAPDVSEPLPERGFPIAAPRPARRAARRGRRRDSGPVNSIAASSSQWRSSSAGWPSAIERIMISRRGVGAGRASLLWGAKGASARPRRGPGGGKSPRRGAKPRLAPPALRAGPPRTPPNSASRRRLTSAW